MASNKFLTGTLVLAGDIAFASGETIPGLLIKMERDDLRAATTLPMYQPVVAVVPQSLVADHQRVLAWFIEQFRGESGAGESHWEQYPEYREALRLTGQPIDPL